MVANSNAGTPAIQLRQLVRAFGDTLAVDHVSWDIPAGSICGFIGPNGAGKTTTLRILATIDTPTQGDAMVNGMSVVQDADRVRRLIGFMPDQYGKYSNLTCEEYLDFFARAYGLVGQDRVARVRDVMAFTGVEAIKHKLMTALSKGMMQRLCLGRALIHDPEVLILDEPAAGLDPRARRELRDMCVELAAQGKTLLISSHVLTELAEFVDHVGILERGRLVATGSVDDIRKQTRAIPTVHMRTRGPADRVESWLREHYEVSDVELAGNAVSFRCPAAIEDEGAGLLRAAIMAGLEVVEFRMKTESLEETFLRLTKGEVQ